MGLARQARFNTPAFSVRSTASNSNETPAPTRLTTLPSATTREAIHTPPRLPISKSFARCELKSVVCRLITPPSTAHPPFSLPPTYPPPPQLHPLPTPAHLHTHTLSLQPIPCSVTMADVAAAPNPQQPVPLDTIPISPAGDSSSESKKDSSTSGAAEGEIRTVFHDPENFNVKHPLMNNWTLWFTKPPSGKVSSLGAQNCGGANSDRATTGTSC